VQQSIDISHPPGPQQQTRRTLLQPANGTETRTDIVPFHRPSKLQKLPTDYSEAVINTVEATNHSKEIFTMLLALFFF